MRVNFDIVYDQGDSRWGSEFLGFNTQLPYNLANYGCLDSCLAMVCKYFGKGEDPLALNNYLKSKKGFTVDSGLYIYGSLTRCYPDIIEKRTETPSLITDAQIQEIKTALDSGFPVVCQIDYNPKTVANDMHFVAIVDYNPNDENDFTIADPLGGQFKSLKSYLGWWKPNARKTIEQYIIYEGPKPKQSAGQTTIDKKQLGNLEFVKE